MKMRSLIAAVGALAVLVNLPGSVAGAQNGPWNLLTIESPAANASAQPQLTVSARGILLSWVERAGDAASLKFSEWRGGSWTPARTVASGRDWFVNWADVPSVIRLADGTLYGHWLQKSGTDTYAYDVRLARSIDDGKTWGASFTPHTAEGRSLHGI